VGKMKEETRGVPIDLKVRRVGISANVTWGGGEYKKEEKNKGKVNEKRKENRKRKNINKRSK
jgi:hypothetical protein